MGGMTALGIGFLVGVLPRLAGRPSSQWGQGFLYGCLFSCLAFALALSAL